MKTRKHIDEYLAIVSYKSKWRFYIDFTANWVMDMATYSPSSLELDTGDFRNGILTVDVNNAHEFLEAIAAEEIDVPTLLTMITESKKQGMDNFYAEPLEPTFLIDFDQRLYVTQFTEIAYEEYVPKGWRGVWDNPLNYTPSWINDIWKAEQ